MKIIDKEMQLTSFNNSLFLNEKWISYLASNIRANLKELENNALTIWIVWSWWSWKSSFLNIIFDKFAEKWENIKYLLEKDDKENEIEILNDIKWFFDKFKKQKLSEKEWQEKMNNKFEEINKENLDKWLNNITKLRKIEIWTENYYIIWINSWLFSNLKTNPMISLLNYVSLKLNLNISNILEELISFWVLFKKWLDWENDWLSKLSIWVASITKLKDRFEKLLEKYLWENTKILLVIDDLDRISPKEAVILLDWIKLFLDNKYMWVFLLNDKDIVKRWLKEKLWLEDEKEVREIATSYLDKLINLEINIEKYYNENIFKEHIKQFIYFHPFIRLIDDLDENIYEEKAYNKQWTFLNNIENQKVRLFITTDKKEEIKEINIYDALYKLKNMRTIKKLFKNFEIQWPALLYSYYPNIEKNNKSEKYFEIFKQMLEEYLDKSN